MRTFQFDLAKPGMQLGLFALIALGLLGLLDTLTAERITENQRLALQKTLESLLPDKSFDNDVLNDTLMIQDERLGSSQPVTIYRARRQGQPVAVVVPARAPDGYNGNIRLLLAIRPGSKLAGVRVLEHHETPGLGDLIESQKSDWSSQFSGRSLTDPPTPGWRVKRDGGAFDQLTGATITSRAVIGAVQRTLEVMRDQQDRVFQPPDASHTETVGHPFPTHLTPP